MFNDHSEWCFIVVTDSYAGNFERELVGWMTGQHNYTHGQLEADTALGMMDTFLQREICPILVPSGTNHEEYSDLIHVPGHDPSCCAVGVWFDRKPTYKAIDFMKDQAKSFCERPCKQKFNDYKFKITAFRFVRKDVSYH